MKVLFGIERWPPKIQEQYKLYIAQTLFYLYRIFYSLCFPPLPKTNLTAKTFVATWFPLLAYTVSNLLVGLNNLHICTARIWERCLCKVAGRKEEDETSSLIQPPLCLVTHCHDSFALVWFLKLCARFKAVTIFSEQGVRSSESSKLCKYLCRHHQYLAT